MTNCVLGFNGERPDRISGNILAGNGYRAYNTYLMRFTSPDSWSPFGAGGINPYAYCDGDPINRTDPTGHFSWLATAGLLINIFGILDAAWSGGASLIAAGSLDAALGSATTASLLLGALPPIADITAIASNIVASHHPQAASTMGWAFVAAGMLSLGNEFMRALNGNPVQSLAAEGAEKSTITEWGHNMRDLTPLARNLSGNMIYTFVDSYRCQRRLNIVGHGLYYESHGFAVLRTTEGNSEKIYTGYETARLIEQQTGIDFNHYRYARLIICRSANGGVKSFASGFAKYSGLITKGFVGNVYTRCFMDYFWQEVTLSCQAHFTAADAERANIHFPRFKLNHGNNEREVFRVLKARDGFYYHAVTFSHRIQPLQVMSD